MKRTVSKTVVGTDRTRHRTRIEDDPSTPDSSASRRQLFLLLDTVAQQQDLLNCGYSSPQRILIQHTGTGWVIEAEATVVGE